MMKMTWRFNATSSERPALLTTAAHLSMHPVWDHTVRLATSPAAERLPDLFTM